jgi:hypothetical protein
MANHDDNGGRDTDCCIDASGNRNPADNDVNDDDDDNSSISTRTWTEN